MKEKEELELLAAEALKIDAESHTLTYDEAYWFRRGFVIAYQTNELNNDNSKRLQIHWEHKRKDKTGIDTFFDCEDKMDSITKFVEDNPKKRITLVK